MCTWTITALVEMSLDPYSPFGPQRMGCYKVSMFPALRLHELAPGWYQPGKFSSARTRREKKLTSHVMQQETRISAAGLSFSSIDPGLG